MQLPTRNPLAAQLQTQFLPTPVRRQRQERQRRDTALCAPAHRLLSGPPHSSSAGKTRSRSAACSRYFNAYFRFRPAKYVWHFIVMESVDGKSGQAFAATLETLHKRLPRHAAAHIFVNPKGKESVDHVCPKRKTFEEFIGSLPEKLEICGYRDLLAATHSYANRLHRKLPSPPLWHCDIHHRSVHSYGRGVRWRASFRDTR